MRPTPASASAHAGCADSASISGDGAGSGGGGEESGERVRVAMEASAICSTADIIARAGRERGGDGWGAGRAGKRPASPGGELGGVGVPPRLDEHATVERLKKNIFLKKKVKTHRLHPTAMNFSERLCH